MSLVETLSNLYHQLGDYVGQFESLVGWWEQDWFDMLQQDTPTMHLILMLLSVEQIKDVGAKEIQLLGASSGSRTAAGAMNFVMSGAGSAGAGKEAET